MNQEAEPSKAKTRRVKRKKVQASDGWTTVTHSEQKPGAGGKEDEGLLQQARITNTVDGLTVPKMLELIGRMTERWKQTTCAKGVSEILGKKSSEGWNVKEALCIGIGSFSLDWEHRHRSMWQLVLFLDVIGMVSKDGTVVNLYAQEPIFTPLDEAFLSALNITVLSSGIETHVAHSSFVFAPFVDWDLLLSAFLKKKDPKLYIGNDMLDDYSLYANTEKKKLVLEECNELGKTFLEERIGMKVPELGLHPHALNGLMAYWKKAEKLEDD